MVLVFGFNFRDLGQNVVMPILTTPPGNKSKQNNFQRDSLHSPERLQQQSPRRRDIFACASKKTSFLCKPCGAAFQRTSRKSEVFLEQDRKRPKRGYPWEGQASLIKGLFIREFSREDFQNRPDHGYPFCGTPFGSCRVLSARRIFQNRKICLVAPCGWEFNRGRGRGWESRLLSRFCFAHVLKGF